MGLPTTRYQHDSLFVVVDKLTKVAQFILRNTTYDAVVIARKFMKEIFWLHGFPKNIISDRVNKFTLEFWQALHKEVGTKLNFSLAYYPEIDDRTKRVNQIFEDMLRMYCMNTPFKW